ncbi:MAG: glycosyltransferase family 2 protein, partial [Pseudodonghicola sp.]
MRIYLHIGPQIMGAARLQQQLDQHRTALKAQGVLLPRAPGSRNHTRLYMAVSDPDHIDPLRFNRGFIPPQKQKTLYDMLARTLAEDVAKERPQAMILSAAQLGSSLHRTSELERLRDLLSPLSDDIRIVAHVEEPARALARAYSGQVMEGRAAPLDRELEMAASADNWWQASLAAAPRPDPAGGQFLETQAPPFWLDYTALVAFWEATFGAGSVTLRPYEAARFHGPEVMEEIRAAFGLAEAPGVAEAVPVPPEPSAAWLARARQLNALLLKVLEHRQRIL